MKTVAIPGVTLAFCVALSAGAAHGALITFDDLPLAPPTTNGEEVPDGYAGLNWDEFYYMQADVNNHNPSGYQNAEVSDPHIAFASGVSLPITTVIDIDPGMLFNFTSGWFTAAWYEDLDVTVVGSNSGVDLYTDTFQVDTTGPTFRVFNFIGVDTVTITGSGGTSSPFGASFPDDNTHFVVDNLDITTYVPEPASLTLVAVSASAVWARRRVS